MDEKKPGGSGNRTRKSAAKPGPKKAGGGAKRQSTDRKRVFKRDDDEPQMRRRGDSKAGKSRGRRHEPVPIYDHEVRFEKNEPVRLNKYIAAAGVCSRREADSLIEQGKVTVNGVVIREMGQKVMVKDKILVDGQEVRPEEFVYILLNKPKNTISTTDDERDRRTVLDVIEKATGKRVYPVGRLDRNTTGLMLLTNDGELAHRLMHPSYKIRKVYQVETNMILSDEQITALRNGVQLDDGPARAYRVDRHPVLANVIRMSIIEGRNHQVKRMISAVNAEVISLKRVIYAGLEIDDLRSGKWRSLSRKEIFQLRQLVKLLDKKTLNL